MKDRALEIVAARPPAVDGRNVLREYVQSRVLGALQEAGGFVPLAFMGGTALRFLYRIPRFSEDLDFTLERDPGTFSFAKTLRRIEGVLAREGYALRVRTNERGVVAKAMLGFVGLAAEAGLTPHADEVLWVKVEVDTEPPAGAELEVTLVDRFGPLRLQHHDLRSLFAGKIAAVLAREYTKGRDIYDLVWYLSREDRPEPNAVLLANALAQTAPSVVDEAARDWRAALADRLGAVDWVDARRDVGPFLEQARDIDLIDSGTLLALLGSA